MDKKFIIEDGEGIEIIIARKTNGRDISVSQKKKGIISAHRKPDYLARRKKKGVYIQLYDLGRIKSGTAFVDLAFTLPNVNNGSLPILTASDAATYRDSIILAYDKDQWKNLFYRIHKNDVTDYDSKFGDIADSRYYFQLLIGTDQFDLALSSKWTDQGIKLTESEAKVFALYSPLNLYFDEETNLGSNEYLFIPKFTTSYDYESEGVSFTPSQKMDVYLMPEFVANFGRSITGNKTVYLNYFFNNHSRSQFLINYNSESSTYINPNGANTYGDVTPMNLRSIAYFKQIPNNRSFVEIMNEDESTTTYEGAGSEFADTLTSGAEFLNNQTVSGFSGKTSGTLIAVIKQGENWFYMWND